MLLVASDLAHIVTSNVGSGTISLMEETEQPRFGPPPPPGSNVAGANAPGAPAPPPAMRKVWRITAVPAGRGPEGFDVSPDGKQVWAANSQDATVTVIDVASRKAVQTFAIPIVGANRLKFTLDGRYALVSGLGMPGPGAAAAHGTNLAVIDAATHAVVRQIDLGGGAAGVLMDPDGSRAYVAVSQGNRVAVVDLKTLQLAGEIAPLNQPDGLAWAMKK